MLSPDGSQILLTKAGTNSGLWLRDAARESESRLTAPPLGGGSGVWSPDGRMFAFSGSDGNLYRKEISGGKQELLLKNDNNKRPSDWSRDGRYLLFTQVDPKTRGDIWVLPDPGGSAATGQPFVFQRTNAMETQAQLSPDGKWIAYVSNESDASEIYVRPFPTGPGRWKVSTGGGVEPRWRNDGRELYYRGPGTPPAARLMAVPVKAGANGSFAAGEPQPLFEHRYYPWMANFNRWAYSVTPDGKRFLVLSKPAFQDIIHVLSNWTQIIPGKK